MVTIVVVMATTTTTTTAMMTTATTLLLILQPLDDRFHSLVNAIHQKISSLSFALQVPLYSFYAIFHIYIWKCVCEWCCAFASTTELFNWKIKSAERAVSSARTLSHKQMAVNSSMAWSRHMHIITSKMRQFTKTHRAPLCTVRFTHRTAHKHTLHTSLHSTRAYFIHSHALFTKFFTKSHVMVGNYKKYANFGEFHDIYALSCINVNIFRCSLLLLFLLLLELLLGNNKHKT